MLALLAGSAGAQGLPEPLTDTPGDPLAGRTIVTTRELGLCVLCHAGPFPDVAFAGNLGPDLAGVGSRLTIPELRQRIVDSRVPNPATIMPPYFSTEGLSRVGEPWRGATILNAQEVEDVVAYLATLKEEAQ
ncbi:sulfur oxidation c-type cytochrome SoxX [Alexandriicola marinus]|uniref:sulfur oxidation c-type cytochrome SoxX n=1 Tax=Alexandriicola marinus TaxID=2081710 RepID=UPI001F0C30D7|nr:sulfur oxidation c-type cytochrome SoxX [Alexandriicola marinus]